MLRYLLLAALTTQAAADAGACAAALADMTNPQSENAAKNALARFTCPNVLAAAGFSLTSVDTYAFAFRQHMSNFGDPDACESIGGFRYVGVQYPGYQWGLCVPRECDAENLNELLKMGKGLTGATKIVSGRFRFRMGAGGGFMVALFVILVVAALVATACEPRIVAHVKGIVYKEDYALVTEVYRGPAWLRCFSLVKNYDQWLSRREDNPLSCLDGVRVVSMLMVIHGHTLIVGLGGRYTNGLLATRALVKYAQGRGWKWIPQSYLFRYLRLTPLYFFVLLFWWKALRVVGLGPQWLSQRGAYQKCKRYWWTNMLYVNNLVPFKDTFTEQCFGHAWYLGNDMQFFIILPLFIVAYTYNRRAGYASLFAGFWASIIYSLWGADHFHWSAGVDGPPHQVDYYYLRPWTRIPPYLVGSATALLLNDVSSKPSRIICEAMKLVALLILGLCYFGAYPFWQSPMKHGIDNLNHSYVALTKPAWAVALSLLCWPSFRGHRGMIGRLLELPLWEPLAKLTYAMYLIHMPVLEIFFKARRGGRIYFSYTWWGFAFLGVSCATGLVAVVLYLFVELPFHNLVMLLRKRLATPRAIRVDDDDALAELAEPLTEPTSPASEVEVN
jgi:peptidoglycan/LPS O-acetylase OafA/YrhL